MNRLRILQFGKYYPPYRGGIERVVEQLCKGLARRRVEVLALVSNDKPRTQIEQIEGVQVVRLGRQLEIYSQPINAGLPSFLRHADFDILHVHTPNPLGALLCSAFNHTGKPVIVTHHSDIVRQRWLGGLGTRAHRALYRRARAIVVATPRHIEFSNALGGLRARCQVIHYPIDPESFAQGDPGWDSALPEDFRDHPLALFVGRLVYYKGVDVLLRALSRVPRLRLAVVGTGPLSGELLRLCNALGLDARVRFLGEVDDARLPGLYRSARFLVLPSVAPSEAFGLVQLEAMSASTAVISTNLRSGVPYVNRHGVTGLVVEPGSVEDLARAMARLSEDAELARELGREGRVRVHREFHIDQVIDQYLALYRSLMPNSRGSG